MRRIKWIALLTAFCLMLVSAPAAMAEDALLAAPVDEAIEEAEGAELWTEEIAKDVIAAEAEENATSVAIVRENFPDRAFRKYIKANFDLNGNGRLSRAERLAVTEIDACGLGIGSLKGIAQFPNLMCLRVSGNRLRRLDVSQNTGLTVLDCSGNRMTKLDVRYNAGLMELDCSDNRIRKLNLWKNTALESLRCAGNGLTKLVLGRCGSLNIACLQDNALESISISFCPQLRALTMNRPLKDPPGMEGKVCFGDPDLIEDGLLIIDADTQLTQRGLVVYPQTRPRSVAFADTMIRAEAGSTLTLTPVLTPVNASTTYTWQSSRKRVATVDENGVVTLVGPGMAIITVTTRNGRTASCTLNVTRGRAVNVAHRGGAGYWPENTLEAFRNAVSTGADAVELDVRSTRDGVQVVNHSEAITVDGRKYYIREQTLARLRELKPDLCTLAEALEVIRDSGLELQMELKLSASPRACLKLVRRYGLRSRVTYISFEEDLLAQMRALDPNARLGFIFCAVPSNLSSIISDLRLHALLQGRFDLTHENLVKWQESGILVGVWTLQEESEVRRWLDEGVDFITSDYPGMVTQALGR